MLSLIVVFFILLKMNGYSANGPMWERAGRLPWMVLTTHHAETDYKTKHEAALQPHPRTHVLPGLVLLKEL